MTKIYKHKHNNQAWDEQVKQTSRRLLKQALIGTANYQNNNDEKKQQQ